MLVFKGVPESTLETKLNNLPDVKNKKVYFICQKNAWVDSNTFVKWLKLIWFRAYSFRKTEDRIIYFDRATSHLSNEINDLFKENKCLYL